MKVYIYGLGKGKQTLDRCLIRDDIEIIAYIDRYKAKKAELHEGIPVIDMKEISDGYDKIIITLMQYEDVKADLCAMGIDVEKIICFYSLEDVDDSGNWRYIDLHKWRNELLWKNYTEVIMPSAANYPYEIYSEKLLLEKALPTIVSAKETVEMIRKEKKSLSRFGDNEFELILGRERTNYQTANQELGVRLEQVLKSQNDRILVAVADNYGSLEKYTDEGALAIRQYLGTGRTRKEHMSLLDLSRTYYDAYLSRPYMIYRDKENAEIRFRDVQNIWTDRDVLVVEGEHTRFGVGNDLLDHAKSVQRILTLDRNCFDLYDKLICSVKEFGNDKLILMILGPTATVMAHDLALDGFWAIDIGQLDIEYEWFLRQVDRRCGIPYKTVSEVTTYDVIKTEEDTDYIKKYKDEIIKNVTE